MHGVQMLIRPLTPDDHDALWAVLEPVIRAGETYALPRDMARDAALSFWTGQPAFVAQDREILGSYFLRPNKAGGGAHVANCGYVTAPGARGRGVGAAMCAHSLEEARSRGFRAMQFNFVVASNRGAVRLWQRHGFAIVGTLAGAFDHPTLGEVDAHVMYRRL